MEVITPTQFILNAAKLTPTVSLPMDKKINYTFPELSKVPDKYCFLCGNETRGQGTLRKKTIKESFTDIQAARYMSSESCCEACSFCLSHMSLRNYSILATKKGLFHLTRPEIRNTILLPPEPPFLLCVAESGQKWLHYRSKINYSKEEFKVRFEEIEVVVNPVNFCQVLTLIEKLYMFFSKEEIKTGKYSQERIRRYGIIEFSETEDKLNYWKKKDFRLFSLALFVAQKQEEEKKPMGKPPKQEPEPVWKEDLFE